MPPPSRPNTSLGFSRDEDSNSISKGKSQDDSSIGVGLGHPTAESSKAGSSTSKPVSTSAIRKPMSMFMPVGTGPGLNATRRPGAIMRNGRPGITNRFPVANSGQGSGTRHKVSQQTSLPSVMASPVKGGAGSSAIDDSDVEMQAVEVTDAADVTIPDVSSLDDEALFGPSDTDGKGKEKANDVENRNKDRFRRASLAHEALSQSLNSLPIETPKEVMGPPATPPRRAGLRSSSSTYPSSSVSSSAAATNDTKEEKKTLKILQDCKVFVDVRNQDGQDVGSWFIDGLKDLGARVSLRFA
jgi:hypothetical protein